MSGKRVIPDSIHRSIRRDRAKGYSVSDLMERYEVSRYTVRRALDEDYAAQEAERQRRIDRSGRYDDPEVKKMRKERYFDTPAHRDRMRSYMRVRRQDRPDD